jgi:CheY-like chemotaxis protein
LRVTSRGLGDVYKRQLKPEGIRNVPMIFVTARKTPESKRDGLSAGAVDYPHPV